ncbi:MAG: sulfatase-like hydrolase/transferase [Candidatus Hydrogenedentes bacterium]|nr:sulfatase-like hydrolase/transferase [Candidatus Hydrogenedentota bacterium]
MTKRLTLLLLKAAVSAALFVLLFHPEWFRLKPDLFNHVSPSQVLAALTGAGARHTVSWLAFAAAVRLLGMLAGVLRWQILLRGQGLSIPFGYMARSWFVGRYFGLYFPGTLGLDGYRLVDSSLYTGEVIKCTTVIAIEKLIGFIALTFLVLLTFPLGFRLLKINWVLFALLLVVMGAIVLASFLLLLNPRAIQALLMTLPVPGAIRGKVSKLGAAVTAYSGNRLDLLLAVFFGLLVHLGACLMYFGTMMAIRAPHTSLLDILFASPLLIYGTVVAPVIGGMGVRELVFVTLLGDTSGQASALAFAHLGWWVGDLGPYIVGWILFVFKPVRTAAETKAKWAELRAQARQGAGMVTLSPEQIRVYRERLADYVLGGALGGLVSGALIGLAEAKWLTSQSAEFTELGVLCWGPLAYGIVFVCVGTGLAACAAFLSLLFDRFICRGWVFAWCLGGLLGLGTLGVGGFRYYRDVMLKHDLTPGQLAALIGAAITIALIAAVSSGLSARQFNTSKLGAVLVPVIVFLAIVSAGGGMAKSASLHPVTLPFAPPETAAGPNIIFLGIDTLRADYLKSFNASARTKTPHLDALAANSVVFTKCFAQAPWTKPSFATMFTGRYPTSHTVTGQDSVMPGTITTLADVLLAAGYYTLGYSNNGNIARVWNFQKGFVDYEDLQPNTRFGAPASAVNTVLYQALRKARARMIKKVVVTDYFQPGEVVTGTALAWLDSAARPKDAPFYLFLHYMDCHDPYIDHKRPGIGYARAAMEHPDPAKYEELFKEVYTGDVEYLDTQLGRLFDGLKQRGLYDKTVIVLTGDHGEEFYEHRGWWHGDTLYDEQLHVPLILKLPGNTPAVNDHLARHVDLAPTLLHLAGLSPARGMQGISLVTAANPAPNADVGFVYSEVDFEGNVLQAVRTNEHKLIHANEGNMRTKPHELYDLIADPGEQADLGGTGRPEERELGITLEGMREFNKGNAAEPVVQKNLSDEQKSRLQAIGYF